MKNLELQKEDNVQEEHVNDIIQVLLSQERLKLSLLIFFSKNKKMFDVMLHAFFISNTRFWFRLTVAYYSKETSLTCCLVVAYYFLMFSFILPQKVKCNPSPLEEEVQIIDITKTKAFALSPPPSIHVLKKKNRFI